MQFKRIFVIIGLAGIFPFLFQGFSPLKKTATDQALAYLVFFTDKNGTSFDPHAYFAPEAIARRVLNGISLFDSSDFPVNEKYLTAVGKIVDTLGYSTRWFNGVGVVATEKQAAQLRALPFVREVVPQVMLVWTPAMIPDTVLEDLNGDERSVHMQISPLEGQRFEKDNKNGSGIIIAVLDAGFQGTDDHEAFAHLRFNNRIKATYDFVRNDSDVYNGKTDHGTMVLSCIGGKVNGTSMGLATASDFLLARIAKEYGNEYRGEENFLAAIEWADKLGAKIVNCSGGPGEGSYFPEQMNGKIPLISRASNMAARKGILVVAAAGNLGQSMKNRCLLPPSDADSVLSVTAVNDRGFATRYSSHGPTPDFRKKPDVCAPGTAIVASAWGDYSVGEGTSFAAPLISGFAACVLQLYPGITPLQLIDTLRRCSSHFPYFDYAHGYGVPRAGYFYDKKDAVAPTFSFKREGNNVRVEIDEAHQPDCNKKQPDLLFYSLVAASGKIYRYEVIEVHSTTPVTIKETDLKAGVKVEAYYMGYYETLQL